MAETLFKVGVPDATIELLHKKLALTILPDELENAGWEYGAPLADIRRLFARWKDGYDWRKYEAQINEMRQFTRDIDVDGFGTLNIHYVHQRSKVDGAIPFLFVHGWPGTFTEVQKILPLLVEGSLDYPAFHVVAPSLPGFGFSEAPKSPGFGEYQYAEFAHKLMLSLGYNEYVTQGGDWGHVVTKRIAQVYGHKHSKAWHTNMPMAVPPHPLSKPLVYLSGLLFGYTTAEKAGMERSQWFWDVSSGYYKQQSTLPQTVGYSLADSPVGLLAWIYEKLVVWTDNYKWDDDEIITWISLYWFSRAGVNASLRIYKEAKYGFTTLIPTTIPMGYSYFPKELAIFPRRWLKAPNLVFESEHASGGHFAAHEKPKDLVDDIRKMFGKGGPAFGVVPGKTGYDK